MLSPGPGLGLEAQKTGLGLMITGLGLMTVVALASSSLASWPRSF